VSGNTAYSFTFSEIGSMACTGFFGWHEEVMTVTAMMGINEK
jgi:hypothetical protein